MKNGSRKPARKKAADSSRKKSARNNAKEAKGQKTNRSAVKNAGRVKQPASEKPLKELKKSQLKERGYTDAEALLIKQGFRVSLSGKVAVNDLKTGRLIWINTDEFQEYNNSFINKQAEKTERIKKEYSDYFDIPLSKTSTDIYKNVRSSEDLEKLISEKKLRNAKGHFMKKDEVEKLREIVRDIEQGKAEFNLREILDAGDLKNKAVKISSQTPKDFFYWNLQNNVKDNDFGTPNITIKDFDGNIIYEGKSSARATSILNKLNAKLDNLETAIEKLENTRAYFTVPVQDSTIRGNITDLFIDYSNVRSRLKGDLHNKYKTML